MTALYTSLHLVIDLADDGQIETASCRVDAHQEVGVAARSLESARASDEVKESLIDTRDWIQGSVKLKIKLCTRVSYVRTTASL